MYTSIDKLLEDFKLRNYAKATISSYQDGLRQFADYLASQGIKSFREVHLNTLHTYRDHMKGKGFNINTIHIRLRAVKRLFEYLEKTSQLLVNPCEGLVMPKMDRRVRTILTQEEVKKILSLPNTSIYRGIRDKALLETLYSTGIRLGECLRLNVYDVDYEGGYLRINKGKGGKDRLVSLGKIACRWIKEYLEKVRPFMMREKKIIKINGRSKKKIITESDERALWVTDRGKRFSAIWLCQLLKRYGQQAKINKQVTVHTFRRSFATHMLQEGANAYYVQQLMGHSHGGTLSQYIKLMPIETKGAHEKCHPREKEGKRWKKTRLNIKRYY